MSYDHQDWTPVVFHKHRAPANPRDKDAVKAAFRSGAGVETVARDAGREMRERARKLDDETAKLPRLSVAMRRILVEARAKKNMTREELAQRINVKPKVIADLESGAVMQDPSILAKVKRVVEAPELRFFE
jgi:ribosome-binding protein aMBF1 (putative translation factor)